MALGDISVVKPLGANLPSSFTFKTEAGSTAINAGEPVKIGGTGSNYVVVLTNGEPEISADVMVGVAASNSTHTASADGEVDVTVATPGLLFTCKATTPANIDTEAELLAVLNDRVTFDLSGGTYTVDENEGDDSDHGLRIVSGDVTTGDIHFIIRQSGCFTN